MGSSETRVWKPLGKVIRGVKRVWVLALFALLVGRGGGSHHGSGAVIQKGLAE
jgi:hypothetical protein